VHDRVTRRVGDDTVHRTEMLFDVHRDALPCVRIAGIGTKSHGGRCLVVEARRHDTDSSTRAQSRTCGIGQRGVIAGYNDHPAIEVGSAHVHSLQFPH